jgi:hypothetical protein
LLFPKPNPPVCELLAWLFPELLELEPKNRLVINLRYILLFYQKTLWNTT